MAEDDARAVCRQWAWNISQEAEAMFGTEKRNFILVETAKALQELVIEIEHEGKDSEEGQQDG